MIRHGLEDVRGTIIGEVTVSGWLRYDGRPQCRQITAKTWRDVVSKGKEKMEELKLKYEGICYDDGKEWEVASR